MNRKYDSFNSVEDEFNRYDDYESAFDPFNTDRKARRARKPRVARPPRRTQHETVEEVAETTGIEGGFKPTYTPSRYEEGWLLYSLQPFFDQHLISDVLAQVKGGKEASVYRCQATNATGEELLAAKVYRPRQFRQLRNDALYREGRAVLNEEGRIIKTSDHRIMRALGKKTAFGAQVAHTSWLMYEFTTLQLLHDAGAAVPRPLTTGENAILMGYVGDSALAAPPLSHITLEVDEAEPLFDEVLRNIEIMLQHDIIHGDLSAFNILYWEGQITLIDFPQVVSSSNRSARAIFRRDVQRVCEYFARQGVKRNPVEIADRLWTTYMKEPPPELWEDETEE